MVRLMHRLLAAGFSILLITTTLISAAPRASAGSYCPELSGAAGTSSQIKYTFIWINDNCPTPIRKGFYASDGFGWDHIEYSRVVLGEENHQTTDYARERWGWALATAGAVQSLNIMCHHVYYETPGGTKRTMKVVHSSVDYEGKWGRKGIITAYWVSGHVDPC
jgi:hypothetical protein